MLEGVCTDGIFSALFCTAADFIDVRRQDNRCLKSKTTHRRAPLRENLQNNGMFELL